MFSPRRRAQLGLLAAVVLFVFSFSIILSGANDRINDRAGLPGSLASAFRLHRIEGGVLSSASLQGKVVVICFPQIDKNADIATDAQRLASLSNQYASAKNVKLIAIYSGVDPSADTQMQQISAISTRVGKATSLIDPTSSVAHDYSVDSASRFFVVDASGIIRYRGGLDDASANAPLTSANFPCVIDMLLAEHADAPQPTPAILSSIK